MTARQLVDIPGIKLAVYALALGIAWATLEAKVRLKANTADVQAMAADIRDIKAILCDTSKDSFCKARR